MSRQKPKWQVNHEQRSRGRTLYEPGQQLGSLQGQRPDRSGRPRLPNWAAGVLIVAAIVALYWALAWALGNGG